MCLNQVPGRSCVEKQLYLQRCSSVAVPHPPCITMGRGGRGEGAPGSQGAGRGPPPRVRAAEGDGADSGVGADGRRGSCYFSQKTFRYLLRFCSLLFRGFFVVFSWLFRGPHLLRKTVFGRFSWLFRGFFVALILGKFYTYSPWKSLLI